VSAGPARRGGRPAVQLLLDAGNSRLKWRLLRGPRAGRVQAAPWGEGEPVRVALQAMRAAKRAGGKAGVARILACSVAGLARERAITRAARAAGLPDPQFIRSARQAAGVRNGYVDPWRLGADRWVALIGARLVHPGRALCLVDAGTALTVDLLDAAGVHRGGLLVPGPDMMVNALLGQTAGIRQRAGAGFAIKRGRPAGGGRAAGRPGPVFGRSTRAGLAAGALLAAAALVDRACAEARSELGLRPLLLLSGGAAPGIAPRLRTKARASDELVLVGLAALAGAVAAAPPARGEAG
jgi:type III pantothenate kinase